MNNFRVIDKHRWPRAELFDFYRKFDDPCFNVSVTLAGGNLYTCAKDRGESFFLLALYAILRAANAVPQIRQRVLDGAIVEFESIAVMTPVMTGREMFRQIWCEYAPSFPAFAREAGPKAKEAREGLPAPMEQHGEDFLCASCLPWLHFTSVTQAEYRFGQTVPILSWGKLQNGLIPVSCKFNHVFVDGLHVGRFFAGIEKSFADPDTLWESGGLDASY
ncbi:MAG: CatA-like O-acetyltransferase [Deltaproteobacteria bacterium]|nr:CatA-like O-acetyltransferase [Deltaproteobacteria bacterium]